MPLASSQFGVQGGYWGTGRTAESFWEKAMSRLLSPDEYSNLDNLTRNMFGSYMGYLNAFTRRQRGRKEGREGFLAAREGRFEPLDVIGEIKPGPTISTRGRQIPTAAEQAAGARIPTTLKTDISGRVTRDITGGGVKRDISGRVIPRTAEQIGAQAEIKRDLSLAIPRAEDITFAEQMAIEDRKLQAQRSAMDRYRTSKEGQAQQRIEVSKQRIAQQYQLSTDSFANQKTLLRLRADLQRGRDIFKNELNSGNRELDQEFQVAMQEARFEHDEQRQAQALDNALKLVQVKFDNAETVKDTDQAAKLRHDIEERVFKLQLLTYKPDLTPEERGVAGRAALAQRGQIPSQQPAAEQPPVAGARRNPNNPNQWIAQKQDGLWYEVKP